MLNRGFVEDVQEILDLLSETEIFGCFQICRSQFLKLSKSFWINFMVSVQRKSVSSQNIDQGIFSS